MSKKYRKANKQLLGPIIFLGLSLATFGFLLESIKTIFKTILSFEGLLLITVFIIFPITLFKAPSFLIRRYKKRKLQELLKTTNLVTDRSHYQISNDDYKRGNKRELAYRKVFKLRLLEVFNNCCAKCLDNKNNIEIDHFFISKNAGGNFILKSNNGLLINNALPLCKSCNSSKSDKTIEQYFTTKELVRIIPLNNRLTTILNNEQEALKQAS